MADYSSMDDWDGEESSWSNIKGYFFVLSKLMYSISVASINKDLQLLHDLLQEQYFLIIGHYPEDEKVRHEIKYKHAQEQINLFLKHENQPQKANFHWNHAKNILNDIKKNQIILMQKANLLVPIQEKGLAIYN